MDIAINFGTWETGQMGDCHAHVHFILTRSAIDRCRTLTGNFRQLGRRATAADGNTYQAMIGRNKWSTIHPEQQNMSLSSSKPAAVWRPNDHEEEEELAIEKAAKKDQQRDKRKNSQYR